MEMNFVKDGSNETEVAGSSFENVRPNEVRKLAATPGSARRKIDAQWNKKKEKTRLFTLPT